MRKYANVAWLTHISDDSSHTFVLLFGWIELELFRRQKADTMKPVAMDAMQLIPPHLGFRDANSKAFTPSRARIRMMEERRAFNAAQESRREEVAHSSVSPARRSLLESCESPEGRALRTYLHNVIADIFPTAQKTKCQCSHPISRCDDSTDYVEEAQIAAVETIYSPCKRENVIDARVLAAPYRVATPTIRRRTDQHEVHVLPMSPFGEATDANPGPQAVYPTARTRRHPRADRKPPDPQPLRSSDKQRRITFPSSAKQRSLPPKRRLLLWIVALLCKGPSTGISGSELHAASLRRRKTVAQHYAEQTQKSQDDEKQRLQGWLHQFGGAQPIPPSPPLRDITPTPSQPPTAAPTPRGPAVPSTKAPPKAATPSRSVALPANAPPPFAGDKNAFLYLPAVVTGVYSTSNSK